MKYVSVDIISDLHLDFYFKETSPINEKYILKVFDKLFENSFSNILIIAGDLGHYNFQTVSIIEVIRKNYYDNVICVLGNHDYYLLSKTQSKNYFDDSFNKARDLRYSLNQLDGVYCLNGDVVEIEGIRFGGADGWYDSKTWNVEKYEEKIVQYWNNTMNDAYKIKGVDSFLELSKIEIQKIKSIYQECDVMITHVSPSIDKENIPEYKKNEHMEGFYTFNGEKFLEFGTMSYWIFGHMHEPLEYSKYGVECISNPLGYPKQSKDFTMKTIFVMNKDNMSINNIHLINDEIRKRRRNEYGIDAIKNETIIGGLKKLADIIIKKHTGNPYIMDKEKQMNLYQAYPTFFHKISRGQNPTAFSCGNGWYDLLLKLSMDITEYCLEKEVTIPQPKYIKSKSGELHFFIQSEVDENISKMIENAIDKSSCTCEVCGRGGESVFFKQRCKVLCRDHYKSLILPRKFPKYKKQHEEILNLLDDMKNKKVTLEYENSVVEEAYICHLKYKTDNGWNITIFIDAGYWDYIDCIKSPEGWEMEYDDLCDDIHDVKFSNKEVKEIFGIDHEKYKKI